MTDDRGYYRDYRDSIDPEYQRWGRTYPRFPGVAECARIIQVDKAKGAWADIISFELARHARDCFTELIDTFRNNSNERVRLFVMMALEVARLPESVPFLIEVLREGNPTFAPHAEHALEEINTRESRSALWTLNNSRPGK